MCLSLCLTSWFATCSLLQLNFYGFRKIRTDPILTSDVDPQTSCYVRFYHEKFQKDKPALLHQIRRATKTDQQSKDDFDSLKAEVTTLKEALRLTTVEYDRKLAELSYECNRRITSMNSEYDKLANLVQRAIVASSTISSAAPVSAHGFAHNAAAAAVTAGPAPVQFPDLLQSLSQVAAVLQPAQATSLNPLQQQTQTIMMNSNGKRPLVDDGTTNGNPPSQPRIS